MKNEIVVGLSVMTMLVAPVGSQDTERIYEGKTISGWIVQLTSGGADVRTDDGRVLVARGAAAEALGRIGKPAVEPLRQLLKSDKVIVRSYAARALGFVGAAAEDAVPDLIAALNDFVVVSDAAAALGQIGSVAKRAVPALIDLLRRQRGGPKVATALGLIRSDADAVVPVLIAALKYTDQDYRLQAVKALGSFGPLAKEAIPALREIVNEEASPTGGTIDVRDFLGALNKAGVRIAAKEALARIEK